MNIFFTAIDPYEAATNLVDKHVVKMIVETAQLLSTAHRIMDGDDKYQLSDSRNGVLYKCTHRNHPSAVWTRTSVENYNWLVDHLDGLLREYAYRYDKEHATLRLLYPLNSPPLKLEEWDWTEPPSCMPDEYKIGGVIDNYRQYYRHGKAHLHKWTRRDPPDWIKE